MSYLPNEGQDGSARMDALLDRIAELEAALDALGVAIADAGYTWTPEMRAAYEKGMK